MESTLSDYFNPLQSAALVENIKNARIQNNINTLALQEQQDKIKKDKALQNVLRNYYGGEPNNMNGVNPNYDGFNKPIQDTRPLQRNLLSDIGRVDPRKALEMDQANIKAIKAQRENDLKLLLSQANIAVKEGNNDLYQNIMRSAKSIMPSLPDTSKTVIGPKPGEISSVVDIKNGLMQNGKPLINPLTNQPVKDGTYMAKGKHSDQGIKFDSVIPYKKPETSEEKNRRTRENIKFGIDYRNAHPSNAGVSRSETYNMTRFYDMVDNDTGKAVKIMGRQILNAPDGKYTPISGAIDFQANKAEATSAARQRSGTRAAEITDVRNMFRAETPELISLRRKVAEKGMLPDTRFKDLNSIKQWTQIKSSDTDVAELKGRVLLLAEQLQRSIGKGGGDWAFKVASELIDPTLSPDAFERRLESHGRDLNNLVKSRESFGKNKAKKIEQVTKGYTFNPSTGKWE